MAAAVIPLGAPAPAPLAEPQLEAAAIQGGLDHPWDSLVLPDGRLLVSERASGIHIYESTAPGAAELGLVTIDGLHAAGEAGVMGLVADPDVASNGHVYVCASRDDGPAWVNQVLRFSAGETLTLDSLVIREGMRAGPIHDGCRLRFGADGMLYVTMGDAGRPQAAQDPRDLNGKVLRVRRDGSIPPDNPVLPGAPGPSAVFTLGHRNPQGLALSPADGSLLVVEHAHHRVGGSEEHGAIYRLTPGANFGWPNEAGPGSGYDQPLWTSGDRPLTVSGGDFGAGPAWLDWSGDLFVGALNGGQLLHFSYDAASRSLRELPPLFEGVWGRLRSPTLGPDGVLYVTGDNGANRDVVLAVRPR